MPPSDAFIATAGRTADEAGLESELLDIVRAVAIELHPELPPERVTLDAVLDRELGIDSLGRVELVGRIERGFDISLPEDVFGSVETPRDLLRAVQGAAGRERRVTTVMAPPPADAAAGKALPTPASAQTLLDMFAWHARTHPERLHIRLYSDEGDGEGITYGQLFERAAALAAGLQGIGVQPGDRITLMLPTGPDYFFAFFGTLLAGAVPVPIYPPVRRTQIEEHLRRQTSILRNCLPTALITVAEAKPTARLLRTQVETLRHVCTVDELCSGAGGFQPPSAAPQDIALLQYTSGSTGDPKGVVLTHANLLANIRADGERIAAGPEDVFVSWLPLYHDMGLIGAWLASACFAVPLVIMSPLAFLGRPSRWLWAIHRHRGTISAAPNFAFDLCLNRVRDEELEGLDLSSWRVAFNGAEAVSPETVTRFCERFERHGFRPGTMYPVYGLAEAAVGLAFPPLGRPPLIDHIEREPFTRRREALPAPAGDATALRFVACGHPLSGHEIRIVDAGNRELPERREGRLQFRGPSSTSGYYRNATATRSLFHDGWLDSGDLAYMAGGELYITGRAKDVIIRAGRNVYPEEVETVLGRIDGIRFGRVAVFGSADPHSGTERLVVLAETRARRAEARRRLEEEVRAKTTDLIGIPPDEIVLAPPNTVLKTSSGKLRRAASRKLFESGAIGKPTRALWWQLTRLMLAGLVPQLHRLAASAAAAAYAGWAWLVFGLLGSLAWVGVVTLPRVGWRWAVIRHCARGLARLTATPLTIRGLEHLPRSQHCVLVANHASYVDGYALVGVVPVEFGFVAKRELLDAFGVGAFLDRIGTVFVERFDTRQAAAEESRITALARAERSLLFFPEGTFSRIPGLLPFHMGAFVAAADSGLPVVPIAIRGTRSILRSGSWFPRHGAITVTVGEPIEAPARDDRWASALALRDAARRHILRHCGEPDLTHAQVRGTGSVIGWGD